MFDVVQSLSSPANRAATAHGSGKVDTTLTPSDLRTALKVFEPIVLTDLESLRLIIPAGFLGIPNPLLNHHHAHQNVDCLHVYAHLS